MGSLALLSGRGMKCLVVFHLGMSLGASRTVGPQCEAFPADQAGGSFEAALADSPQWKCPC